MTANTQKADGEDQHVDPVQAPLWGLGRTVAIEYPGIWGGLIDLHVNGAARRTLICWRRSCSTRMVRPRSPSPPGAAPCPKVRQQSACRTAGTAPRVRGDATYLVTGGLGMLGRSVAKWLIGKGAKHLVLTGRNASAEAAQKIFSAAEINSAASMS